MLNAPITNLLFYTVVALLLIPLIYITVLMEQRSAVALAAIVFLVIALIAAVFGFGGIAASAVGIAKILFFVFLVMAVITFLMGLVKK